MIRSFLPVLLLTVAFGFAAEEGFADGDDGAAAATPAVDEVPLLPLWERQKQVPVIHWATEPQIALEEAGERQVPLWVVVHAEEDPVFKILSEGTYIDNEFCNLINREVVPIAIILPPQENTGHAEQRFRRKEKGDIEHRCPFLRSVRCKAHQNASQWLAGGPLAGVLKRRISGYWLLTADGTILRNPEQLRQGIAAGPFAQQIAKARKELGPSYSSHTNWLFTKQRIEGVLASLAEQKFSDGSKIANVLLQDRKKFSHGIQQQIDGVVKKLSEAAQALLDRAATVQQSSPKIAIKLLGRVEKGFRGLPESIEARRRITLLREN